MSNESNQNQDNQDNQDENDKEFGTFNDLRDSATSRSNKQKEIILEDGDLKYKFKIRPLSSKEFSKVETKASMALRDQQGIDSWVFKVETIKCGVLQGPKGFSAREKDIEQLPPVMIEELVEEIQEISGLSEDDAEGFQEIRGTE